MKISDMTNDQATEALMRLAQPFENICNDSELIESLDKIGRMGEEPIIKVVGTIIPAFVKIGISKHRSDLYEIVGALTLQPTNKIGKMNFKETIKTVQDSYDEILRDFFTSTDTLKRIAVKRLSSH